MQAFPFLFLFINLFMFNLSLAQDSVYFDSKIDFEDGIYLNHEAFIKNKPILKSQLIHSNVNSTDFWDEYLALSTIEFYGADGTVQFVDRASVFGACMHGAPYVQTETGFYKLVIIGNLCYFPANRLVEMVDPAWGYSPVYSPYPQGSRTTTNLQLDYFFFQINQGEILDLSEEQLRPFLEESDLLLEEFEGLRKKERRKMLPYFVRKYNTQFPVFLEP